MNMKTTFYKYQGAGNDFLIADNRDGSLQLTTEQIETLCDRRYGVGADGLMLLESSGQYDFRMVYYNSDGSGGMMCGNGGRCMVAFAADMGITHFDFEAADGFHTAEILSSEGVLKTVRLKMKDVASIETYEKLTGVKVPSSGCFLDTGTRHYVRFLRDIDAYDIVNEGREIRYNAAELQPIGTNVNYVEPLDGYIKVRTYEKGVEDETFACGTGIVASCVAAYAAAYLPSAVLSDGRVKYDVQAKRDRLSVDFIPSKKIVAEDVWLTGPATFVAEIIVDIY
jgi:diaminopimelate epimerase